MLRRYKNHFLIFMNIRQVYSYGIEKSGSSQCGNTHPGIGF